MKINLLACPRERHSLPEAKTKETPECYHTSFQLKNKITIIIIIATEACHKYLLGHLTSVLFARSC